MALRYATMLLAVGALAVAAILGVSAAEPEEAAAASAAGVRSCAGRTVDLSPDEARMPDLHNEARADRGLPTHVRAPCPPEGGPRPLPGNARQRLLLS